MSDTPKTDGCLTAILDTYGYVHQGNCSQRWVNYARELERKLNAANEHIKRLEEAGGQLMMWLGGDISASNRQLLEDHWNKAKEAKL